MYCPKCYSDDIYKQKDKAMSGKHRWKCRNCKSRTTEPLKVLLKQKDIPAKNFVSKRSFVITCAVNNAPIDDGFYAFEKFAQIQNAQLLVVPTVYKWDDVAVDFHEDLQPYLKVKDYVINKNLKLDVTNIVPTAVNPLGGMQNMSGTRSVIFAHTQLAMQMVATPKNKLPRMLHTTGACTKPRYSKTDTGALTKLGKKGMQNHTISALFITVKGSKFWVRELVCDDEGGFYDLGRYYTRKGYKYTAQAEGLVLGDVHVKFLKDRENKAIFEQIETVRPKNIILHDLHDNYATSHHHNGDFWLTLHKEINGDDNIRKETMLSVDFIEKVAKHSKPILVTSNHHDHFNKWFNDYKKGTEVKSFENEKLWGEMQQMGLEHMEQTNTQPNPFKMFLDKYCSAEFDMTDRNEPYLIAGIDVSQHGDVGANGSRGHGGFIKSAYEMVMGHSHTPKIDKGCWWVGVMALDMAYAKGLSSWFATNIVIYPNGKRQMLHIVDGDNGFKLTNKSIEGVA